MAPISAVTEGLGCWLAPLDFLRISDVLGARLPAPPVMGVRHGFASGVFGWGLLSPVLIDIVEERKRNAGGVMSWRLEWVTTLTTETSVVCV